MRPGSRGGDLMAAPRVVLVDDHALCRTGLTDLLQHRGKITVVAALGDPDQVARVLREHQPDLLVLDLRMPTTDGLDAVAPPARRGLRHAGADPHDERLPKPTWRRPCAPACAATCSRTWNPKR